MIAPENLLHGAGNRGSNGVVDVVTEHATQFLWRLVDALKFVNAFNEKTTSVSVEKDSYAKKSHRGIKGAAQITV